MCKESSIAADIEENAIALLDSAILQELLIDHSNGRNIIWATDDYAHLGAGYAATDCITLEAITGDGGSLICPRALKSKDLQGARTRNMAEVFTPLWICNKQNNLADANWFDGKNVFNTEAGSSWQESTSKIPFIAKKGPAGWLHYIASKRLEITCGEAPYLASRYDTLTGEIMPLAQRIGLLDRKLRVIGERTRNFVDKERAKKRWLQLARLALQSTYGFEWAGDNVLLARENLLFTVNDYYKAKFACDIPAAVMLQLAQIVAWNIWQMDGLKCVVPLSCHDYKKERKAAQPNLFLAKDFSERTLKRSMGFCDVNEQELAKCQGCLKDNVDLHNGVYCKVKNWSTGRIVLFKDLLQAEGSEGMMAKDFKFDVVIGNPPYQDRTIGDNRTYQPPVYHKFMDVAYMLSDKVMLIHPARFLFNAGSTPKEWNQKMLHDKHFTVVHYEADSSKIFPNTEIKGGIVITYHDTQNDFGEIDVFTTYTELNSIMKKVVNTSSFSSMSDIISGRSMYRFTKKMHDDIPSAAGKLSKGHENDLTSNVFEKLPEIMKEESFDNCYGILGRINNERTMRYVKKEYIADNKYISKYKVFMPQSSGNGGLGESMAASVVGYPNEATTDTFLSVGLFTTELEAKNLHKYIKTKFARALLSVLKITQANTSKKWLKVPIQDFTPSSDIDWGKSIHEIDLQLYQKYGLNEEEVDFIEKNVKEMA